MGCSNDNCVCQVVREIADVQDEVSNNNNDCCTTSCERSIQQLLSPETNNNSNVNTTIPFILTCKGDCSPFIASGVYRATIGASNNSYFGCVESPILRVKELLDDDECCARLEILLPVNQAGDVVVDEGDEVCDFFTGEAVRNFIATGICLTVDLNCFCGITCLDPITPLPSSQFPG